MLMGIGNIPLGKPEESSDWVPENEESEVHEEDEWEGE
jgi:hypothetical protein